MWIEAPENYVRIAPVFEDAPFEDPVEFSENGTANVGKETGEYLVSLYERIEEHNTEDTN